MAVFKLTRYLGAADIRIFVITRLQIVHIC